MFAGYGFARIGSALKRYQLADDALTINSLIRSRTIAWGDIVNFQLPPAAFPLAPTTLVLVPRNGRNVKIQLSRFRATGADDLLLKSVPGLADWGLERARTPDSVSLSILRTRWKLHRKSILMFAGGVVFTLLVGLGMLLYCWDLLNYFRISRWPVAAAAVVTDIERDDSGKDERVHVTVRYVTDTGRTMRMRRHVMAGFADKHQVGDVIVINYLHNHPSIARVPEWDMDVREWVFGLFCLPLLWMSYRVTKQSAAELFRPLRDVLAWGAKAETGEIIFPGIDLATLYALAPEHHAGAIVLKPPFRTIQQKMGADGWAGRFKRAAIPCVRRQRNLLLFDALQAARFLQRLGEVEVKYIDDYAVLATDDIAELEQRLPTKAAGRLETRDFNDVGPLRLYLLRGAAGPFDAKARAALFQEWIDQRLARLLGGAIPTEIPEVDWAELFNIDPADGLYQILIERRKSGPIVWLRPYETGVTTSAKCANGRWQTTANVRTPRLLNTRRRVLPKAA
jgi:hypothetical protein